MSNLEYMICPKEHKIPLLRDSYAQDFSDGDIDAKTGQAMYEPGLFCLPCNRAYGVSKLKKDEKE